MKHPTRSPVDVATVLSRVRHMLDNEQVENASAVLADSGQNSPAIENAKGVCLLRLGRLEAAMRIFRDLVFPGGAFSIPDDTPTLFRVNYVTALLLLDNLVVGIQLLREIPEKHHPLVQQLKAAVRRWKQSLPWWRRMLLPLGFYPDKPIRLDFLPGALWLPEGIEGPRPMERAA